MKFKRVYEGIDNVGSVDPASKVEKEANKSQSCPHCKGKKTCPCVGTKITCKICAGDKKCKVCNGSGRKEPLKGESFDKVFDRENTQ